MDRRSLLTAAASLTASSIPSVAMARTGTATEPLNVRQYGAIGDGRTDDSLALQAAIDAAVTHKRDLYWPEGTYRADTTLLKPQGFFCPALIAEGGAVLDGSRIADGATLKVVGGSGRLAQARIEGFEFVGGTGPDSTGLEIADQCGVDISGCTFRSGTWGLTFHNENGFTEYVQAAHCAFGSALKSGALRYRRTNGTESFNGSGLHSCTIDLTQPAPTHGIVIDRGALLYNAPLDFQVWIKGKNRVVVANRASSPHLTHGTITLEVMDAQPYDSAPELFGGPGGVGYHQGDITSFGTAWLGPNIKLSGSFHKRVGLEGNKHNGTVVTQHGKVAILKTLGRLTTRVRNIADMGSCIAHVHVSGPDYDYRCIIAAAVGLNRQPGRVTLLATLSEFDVAGANPPDFAVDPDHHLVINGKRLTGFIAAITFVDLGPSLFTVGPSLSDYKPE